MVFVWDGEKVSRRKIAVVVGFFILLAYIVLAYMFTDSKLIVVPSEVVAGLAVIGCAGLMYPFLRSSGEGLAFGYISLKFVEGFLMIVAGLFFLSSGVLFDMRNPIYVWHAFIFIFSAFAFYVLLYRSRIIPRWISVWGVVACVSLLIGSVLELFFSYQLLKLFYILIMANEVFLAGWLIVRGFNLEKV